MYLFSTAEHFPCNNPFSERLVNLIQLIHCTTKFIQRANKKNEINQSQSLSIGSGIVPNDPARPLVKIFWLLYGLPFWENLPSHKTFLFSFFQLFFPSVLFKIRLEYTPSRLSNRIARFEFEMFFFQSVILVVFWFETFLVLK